MAEHYACRVPRGCTSRPSPPTTRSTTSRSSKSCRTIRSSCCSPRTATTAPRVLTWYLGGRSASLSQLLPDVAVHGCAGAGGAAVHRDPRRRAAGVDLPVQDPAPASIPDGQKDAERDATAQRFADAVTAIWHGRAEIDRFNELVLRAGLTWQQVAMLRDLREVPAAGGVSLQPVAHRVGPQRQRRHRAVAGRAVRGDVRPGRRPGTPRRAGRRSVGGRRHRRTDQPRHRPGAARVRLDDPGHAAHQLLRQTTQNSARAQNVLSIKLNPAADRRIAAAPAEGSRSSCTRRGSRACTCGSASSLAADCGGRTVARTSAPRSSVWSRRRRSRTPSSCPSAPRADSCVKQPPQRHR